MSTVILDKALRKAMMFSVVAAAVVLAPACGGGPQQVESSTPDPVVIAQGKQIFRFDTFGDETQLDRYAAHA